MNATGVVLILTGGAVFTVSSVMFLFERFGMWVGLIGAGAALVMMGRSVLKAGDAS